MIPSREVTDHAVEVLNRAFKADPVALSALLNHRVPCNNGVADDPEIQVQMLPGEANATLGVLGLINGVLGTLGPEVGEKAGWGPVAMMVSPIDGSIEGFVAMVDHLARNHD